MYTGLYPTEHGVTHQNRWLADDHETLPETLNDEGVRTGLFTANMYLTESFNMARGFDSVSFIRGEDNKLFEEGLDPVHFLNTREHDEGLARAREILERIADGPVHKNAVNALYFKAQEAYRRHFSDPEPPSWDEQAVTDATQFIRDATAADDSFSGL